MSTGLSQQEQRMQILLDERARVDAEIALMQTSNVPYLPPSHGRSSGHRRRRQDVPRSLSHSGPIARTLSSGHGRHDSVPMSASISHRSAPAMARCGSKSSTSSIPSMPFSNPTGHMPPPLHDRRNNSVLESFMSHQDDPVNEYTFLRLASQRGPLEQLPELDYGEHPTTYFARTGTAPAPALSLTPSPIEAPPTGQWQNRNRLSVSSRRQSFGIQSPATPSIETLTTATTAASEMSRTNSYRSDGINGPFEMLAVNSSNSFYNNNSFDDTSFLSVNIPPSQSKRFSSEEQTLLVTGVGGASHNSFPIFHSPDSTSQVLSPSFDGDMKRSQSNESSSSTSSTKSRAVARLQHQNQIASTRPLAPKTESDEMFGNGSTAAGAKSKSGSADPMPIAKAAYQRPKHERLQCPQCSDYPDGFRGAHELGRHIDRQHKVFVKKWVCVEPAGGLDQLRPINPLSKCKACSNQRKNYGAYYNAAAHLRRAHFKPKARGRSKSSKTEDKPEGRGGKGGGDWPPMAELKRWMKEISVQVTENQQQADDDDGDDDGEVNSYNDEDFNSMSNLSAAPTYSSGFAFNDNLDSTMIDAYPQHPTYNTQGMPSMTFDSLLPQQTIDSMAYASSQASFDSQLVLMNDPMGSFINDHFPQSFDPSSSTDKLNYQTYNPVM